jgi:hypothetical protein
MEIEDVIKNIKSAIRNIAETENAHAKGEFKKTSNQIWKAASNIEYVLFLLALRNPKENINLSWKTPQLKGGKIQSNLVILKNSLEETIKILETKDLELAYRKMWIIRGQLFKIQDFFEKY